MPSSSLRLRVSAVNLLMNSSQSFNARSTCTIVPLAFVAMFFTQLDRQRFEQAECDIHRLKVLCLDIRNITAKRTDGRCLRAQSASAGLATRPHGI